jgi:hypothetical protein
MMYKSLDGEGSVMTIDENALIGKDRTVMRGG